MTALAVNLLGFFDVCSGAVETVIEAAPASTWDAASGASDWTGRQVLEHVLGVNAQARTMISRIDVRVHGSTPDPLDPADPLGSYRSSAADTRAAFDDPDLAQRMMLTPMGMFSGRVMTSVTCLENLVHAWDLSVSAGYPLELDPVAVGYAARAIEDMPDVWHNFRFWGAYAPELPLPQDATPTVALLAILGRKPQTTVRATSEAVDPRTGAAPKNGGQTSVRSVSNSTL